MDLYFKHQDGLYAEVDCADWMDFRRKIYSYLYELSQSNNIYGKYIFRGHSCSSWHLESSFYRTNKNLGLNQKERDLKYDRLITQFRKSYEVYGALSKEGDVFGKKKDGMQDDFFATESIAQHYGISTRLLDFSYSLYVAAFFAFSNFSECRSGLVSVFVIDTNLEGVISDKTLEVLKGSYKDNERNLYQVGAFIKNKSNVPNITDLFKKDSKFHTNNHSKLSHKIIKFDIPVEASEQALDDLNMMRINSMTIFPGISGVVRWINELGDKV
jgi:FRG domain